MRKIIIMCSTIIGIIILMSIGSFIYYKHTYEESVIYDASSDIIQIFINNSDDFDEFVSKFYGHHLWSDYYNDTYDKDFCHDKEFKKYLTDEEYSYIECFNDKYHPAFWGSYHFGFYAKTGQVWFYKQEFLSDDDILMKTKRAEEYGDTIEYLDSGWICYIYN